MNENKVEVVIIYADHEGGVTTERHSEPVPERWEDEDQ